MFFVRLTTNAWKRWAQRLLLLLTLLAITGVFVIIQPTQAQNRPPTKRTYAPRAISFDKTDLIGETLAYPTSLQFGPDDRLYIAQQNGLIYAYTIARDNINNTYSVTATETITLIQTIPNYDDDGTLSIDPTAQGLRQVTGLMVAGTYADPVLYVTSADPRRGEDGDLNLDTNSGTISRLTPNGQGGWDMVHLVRGLPRSEEFHSTNGMMLDTAANKLYFMNGGNTNMGSPGSKFSYTPEYAYSNAMATVDLNVIDAMPVLTDSNGQKYVYDLPTLDDPTRGTTGQPDPGDPFGGNDGLNQAMLVPGGPVQLFATGFRNPYDVVLTENTHRLYTFDNGPNNQWGGRVINEGPGGTCTNAPNEGNSNSFNDNLHYVTQGFYGGHPNPVRGNPDGAKLYRYQNIGGIEQLTGLYDFTADWSPVPFNMADPVECDFRASYDEDGINGVDDGSLAQINGSTNGLVEYVASNFGDAMTGNLLAASYNGNVYRFALSGDGTAVTTQETLFTNFGSLPLDVTAQGDLDIFPGTVWVATYGASNITVFEPADFIVCLGTNNAGLDEDLDGYNNADEIASGTNPCSGGSVPADFDHDFVSDLNDPDDDNDTVADLIDPFQIDNVNSGASLPVDYPFFNNNPGTGFFGLGFTGMMINGSTDYITMYNPDNLTAGGATGRFTVDAASAGDATGAANTQQNAFQTGLNIDANTGIFAVEARLESPFFNNLTPVNGQLQGAYIGSGNQDNYLRIALVANGSTGGLLVTLEEGGIASSTTYPLAAGRAPLTINTLDFGFMVDPALHYVQPRYRADGNAWVNLGSPLEVPSTWFSSDDGRGLALGVIATTGNSGVPFTATWDYFRADLVDGPVVTPTAPVTETPTDTATETPTITPTEIPGTELLVNGGMETDANTNNIPDGWKDSRLTGDKRKCNTTDKVIAFEGTCAFVFKGAAGENAKLFQKVDIAAVTFAPGDQLILSGQLNAKKSTVKLKISLIVGYASQPSEKNKQAMTVTSGYQPFTIPLNISVADVSGIKVQVNHKSTSGKVYLDAVSLKLQTNAGLRSLP